MTYIAPSRVTIATGQPALLPNPLPSGCVVTNVSTSTTIDIAPSPLFQAGTITTVAAGNSAQVVAGQPIWCRVTPGQSGNPQSADVIASPGGAVTPPATVGAEIKGTVDIGTITGTVTIDGTVDLAAGATVDATIPGTVTIDANGSAVVVDAVGKGALLATTAAGTKQINITLASGTNSLLIGPLTSASGATVELLTDSSGNTYDIYVPCHTLATPPDVAYFWAAAIIPVPGTYSVAISDTPATDWWVFGNTGVYSTATEIMQPQANFSSTSPWANMGPAISVYQLSGLLQIISLAEPAAGTDWTYTLPYAARLKRVSGSFAATSATAANRWPMLVTTQAAGYGGYVPMTTAAVVAGTNAHIGGWPTAPFASTANPAGSQTFPFPDEVLPSGTVVQTVTFNIQAGDQWSSVQLDLEPA